MSLEDGIVQYLKKENAELQAALDKATSRLEKLESERKGLYVAVALKFGTMIGPLTTEMVLNTRYMGDGAEGYDLVVVDHVERNEQVVQVRRAK